MVEVQLMMPCSFFLERESRLRTTALLPMRSEHQPPASWLVRSSSCVRSSTAATWRSKRTANQTSGSQSRYQEAPNFCCIQLGESYISGFKIKSLKVVKSSVTITVTQLWLRWFHSLTRHLAC